MAERIVFRSIFVYGCFVGLLGGLAEGKAAGLKTQHYSLHG